MPGLNDLIGTGMAQILPKPSNPLPYIEQINQQKQQQDAKNRYEQQLKERNDKELYGIVGDALNLKDFNTVIHDKVKNAQIELAKKIKTEKPSYADTYIMAQNKAAELGLISHGLNQVDQVIAAQKKEWEGDKRINAANLEALARKDILDDLNKNGKIDPSVNYINRALRKYPQFALTDNGQFAKLDFLPTQKGLKGGYKDINKRGGYDDFDWDVKEYAPDLYDFKDNGQEKSPTLTTKSQPSGLIDADKKPVPMLSDDAWGAYSVVTSNVTDLDRRLAKTYPNLDLESPEAEKLRRIEAYKEVESQKPRINSQRQVKADPIKVYTGGSGSGTTKNAAADWVIRADKAIGTKDPQQIKDAFAHLLHGDKNFYEDVELNGDKITVRFKPPKQSDLSLIAGVLSGKPAEEGGVQTIELDVKDRYLRDKLTRVYQQMMGGDINAEKTQYSANPKTPTGNDTPKPAGSWKDRAKKVN